MLNVFGSRLGVTSLQQSGVETGAPSMARSEIQRFTEAKGGILVRIVTGNGQPIPDVMARVIFGATPRQRSEFEDLTMVDALLAGEATSREFYSTAHGADLSGVAAARKAIDVLEPSRASAR